MYRKRQMKKWRHTVKFLKSIALIIVYSCSVRVLGGDTDLSYSALASNAVSHASAIAQDWRNITPTSITTIGQPMSRATNGIFFEVQLFDGKSRTNYVSFLSNDVRSVSCLDGHGNGYDMNLLPHGRCKQYLEYSNSKLCGVSLEFYETGGLKHYASVQSNMMYGIEFRLAEDGHMLSHTNYIVPRDINLGP